jgi:hypothetical protein
MSSSRSYVFPRSKFCHEDNSVSLDAFVAAVTGESKPVGTAEFVATITGESRPVDTAEFAAAVLGESTRA